MKAILITRDNRNMLANRYGVEPDEFAIGYYLIAEFGDNGEFRHQGMLTSAELDRLFIRGEALDNGFFAIKRR
jgi:hypothetical protein